MTIGTAIVVSIGIICGTFLATVGIGVLLNNKKNKAADTLTKTLTDEINKRLQHKQ